MTRPNPTPNPDEPSREHVEQQSVQQAAVSDTRDGSREISPTVVDRVIIDLTTGARRFETTTMALRAHDGQLIHDPIAEGIYACTCGARPLARASVNFCQRCQRVTCKARCTRYLDTDGAGYCRACARKILMARLWQWLWHIRP